MELESTTNFIFSIIFPQEYVAKKLIENDFIYSIFKNKSSIIYSTTIILNKIYDYYYKNNYNNLFSLYNFPQLILNFVFDDFNSSSIYRKIFCIYSLYMPLKLIEYHICDLLPKNEKQDRNQSRIILLNIIYNMLLRIPYNTYLHSDIFTLLIWVFVSITKNSFNSSYLIIKSLKESTQNKNSSYFTNKSLNKLIQNINLKFKNFKI